MTDGAGTKPDKIEQRRLLAAMLLPYIRELFLSLAEGSPLERAAGVVRQGGRSEISGLTPAAQSLAIVLLQRTVGRPIIVVAADDAAAEQRRAELATFQELTRPSAGAAEEAGPAIFPALDVDPYEGVSPHSEILEQRAVAAWQATQGLPLLVASAVAAASRLAAPAMYRALARTVRRGDILDLDGLTEHLNLVGYERLDPVEMPGQYSIRGGLLDVFSPESAYPVRIELFGDEVESLREFDPATQRSTREITSTVLLPLTTLPPTADRLRAIAEAGRESESSRATEAGGAEELRAETGANAGGDEAMTFPGWQFLVPGREGFHHSIFDLAGAVPESAAGPADSAAARAQAATGPLVVVCEPDAVRVELERFWERLRSRYSAARALPRGAHPPAPPPETIFFEPGEVARQIGSRPGADLNELRIEQIALAAETFEIRAAELSAGRSAWAGGRAEEADGEAQAAGAAPASETRAPDAASGAGGAGASDARAGSESSAEWPAPRVRLQWPSRPSPKYQGAIARLMEELKRDTARGQRFIVFGANKGEVERLADLCTEYGVGFQFGVRPERGDDFLSEQAAMRSSGEVTLVPGNLARGFALPEQQVTLLGYGDVFQGEEAYRAPVKTPRSRSQLATFLTDFRDLAIGDFVVHVEHGIGRYLGLKSLSEAALRATPRTLGYDGGRRTAAGHDGGQRPAAASADGDEFMVLEYADQAKLYVPLTRMDLVQKYRSAEAGAAPQLDKLGGTQWQTRKARAKKALKDMADELLKLYASRQKVEIEPFGADSHLQKEFEDSFPYVETPDQEKAIADVRTDLRQARPMDRLIVGDVGYGKTEVAMRAAFKAVAEGRQVAVLAPTTVLAFQHFETFKNRFAPFPVHVEMLSSFRTPRQQKEIAEKITLGQVDIVIGTHRLLSKDVRFHRLGLLVVDEEQRFGVRHKERLKQLKKEVHVLAMSATPIPRTLNMSLVGLRDMSVIETPPKDRLAIQTVVAAWDENLIRVAIENELSRGGQVYFVHNRVDTIWEIANHLQQLVPQARIVVAHGQMEKAPHGRKPGEAELERAMLQFVRHEADVLVSTTIIENGLDIPLANTMIVNRADRLGLSELYQLRGRVGRSNRRAYAYLLVPADTELTPIARKRLAAMREFSDLGAGFKIAALDLELRGAGNLLGGEQSGHVDAVGFDLYVQMLERAVRELKGERVEPEVETQIHLGLDVRIPAEYIAEENQRLRVYKRLAEAEDERAQKDAMQELTDRYGAPPPAVHNLLAYSRLKTACRRAGIRSLERARDWLSIRFSQESPLDPQNVMQFVSGTAGAQFTPGGVLRVPMRVHGSAAVLEGVERILEQLQGALVQ
jgi:transcription-repair coupling factor (superfamily II helicase)